MPLSYGFASSTAHSIPKTSRPKREAFRLAPLAVPGSSHGTSTYRDNKRSTESITSSWNSRFLCAMSPSDVSHRTGPLPPPTPSSVTAYSTKRTINPGVYICKGEGHSVRHSWIVGGRLVEFPFPESRSYDGHTDEHQRKHYMEEGTQPPISIPSSGSCRRPSEVSTSSIGSASSSGKSYRWSA
ncbi:hypothetical protein TruAng_001426 [Truncatella angustata]|nr:hypothetical protein TruAng_001426 [Truncatella angustata]